VCDASRSDQVHIAPLTERSVADRSRPVEVPDFTRGRWKTRASIDFGQEGE